MSYASGAARVGGLLKFAAAGAALAGGLALAAPASATNITILSGTMHNQLVVDISGFGAAFDAPMEFDTLYGGTPTQLVAFCVDVFHHISLGNYVPNLTYTDSNPFDTTYAYATPALTTSRVQQIGQLVNFGTDVFNDVVLSQPMKKLQLGAVQGAIWEIVASRNVTLSTNPSYSGYNAGVSAATFNTLVDNLAGANYQNYITGYGGQGPGVTLITPTTYPRSGTQSFLYSNAPEPAAWVMMIGGFGLVGATLRRRRVAAA
jgi:hypothetical protein